MGKNLSTLIVGIDEAGRGPLIGDLVIGYVATTLDKVVVLKAIGVRDSKKLDKYRRRMLYNVLIQNLLYIQTQFIPPSLIESSNLNILLMNNIIKGLKLIFKYAEKRGYSKVQVFIDEIKGINIKLHRIISNIKPDNIDLEVIMEPKADEKYPIVSAASIIAKYCRDHSLEPIKIVFGDFGSGYPSDTQTLQWIREIYRPDKQPPRIIRRNWSTLKKYAKKWFRSRV